MTRQNTLSVYRRILKQWPLYLMMVPGLAYLLINNYMPLAGLQLAFKKFKYALGIWKSDFNNFKNFTYLFKSSDAWIIIRNTVGYNLVFILLDTVDNSQINVLTQRTMHRICTAATNEEVSFAYRVAIPRQRFRWRNAFSTRWRSL